MDELATLAPLAQLGAAGLLLAVAGWLLRAIVRGDWVSRRELDYVRGDRDARLAEKDHEISEWRGVAETERTAREVAVDHARDLASGFTTVERALDALRSNAEGRGRAR